jgi:hypothetical protein
LLKSASSSKELYKQLKLIMDVEVDINSAWETMRDNMNNSAKESLGYNELKKHKPWFDKGCSNH